MAPHGARDPLPGVPRPPEEDLSLQRPNGKAGTIGSFPARDAVTMVDATNVYALNGVSPLRSGTSFSTTWKNSY